MGIKGLIFDLDGTIVNVPYNWSRINAELGTHGIPILTYLGGLEEPDKSRKWEILKKYEDEATQRAQLKKGMKEFLSSLSQKGVRKALVTNNSRENVEFLLRKFGLAFDLVISRESGLWKPSAVPFLEVQKRLALKKEECAVVGDSLFDVQAAKGAGIERVFLLTQGKEKFFGTGAEIFTSVEALQQRIEQLLAQGRD
jgi:HAD superfamily hydrolase (TIGR01549 family)